MTRPKVDATPGRNAGPSNAPVWLTPRAHPEGSRLIGPGITRATSLVTVVRDEGADSVARILDPCDRDQLTAVIVALAAMVPDDVPLQELLAWTKGPRPAVAS